MFWLSVMKFQWHRKTYMKMPEGCSSHGLALGRTARTETVTLLNSKLTSQSLKVSQYLNDDFVFPPVFIVFPRVSGYFFQKMSC